MKSTPSSTVVSRLRPPSILDLERMTPARLQRQAWTDPQRRQTPAITGSGRCEERSVR
jgi:hypothetical protein